MTLLQVWLGRLGTVLLATVLLGVLVRRKLGLWYSFGAFVFVLVVTSVLIAVWPTEFYNQDFWRPKETGLNLMRFVMALELAYRTFRSFPGALSTLRWVVLLVLGATFVAVLAVGGSVDDRAFLGEMQPRVVNGAIWLFSAIAALILWYRLPIHPFYKEILLSYVPYLLVFTVAMNALAARGGEQGLWVRYANQIAYVIMLAFWSYASWKRAEAPVRPTPLSEPISA
jgi:hypothetical protein